MNLNVDVQPVIKTEETFMRWLLNGKRLAHMINTKLNGAMTGMDFREVLKREKDCSDL